MKNGRDIGWMDGWADGGKGGRGGPRAGSYMAAMGTNWEEATRDLGALVLSLS